MAIDSVATFLDAVRQNQLLEPIHVNECVQDARRFTDPRALAQHLMTKNWLTPFQVNTIFQGQASSLVLGQYRILERLGEGGMGQVYKARHQTMGRIVAIKVIRKDRLGNANLIRRFHREIQLAATLAHPNVVLAFDADQVGGTHFYAMEYVDGTDLSRLVKQSGPLPVATACEYIRQAAGGLQHAHERGLVHRDIKPGNLLVTKGEPTANGPALGPARGKRTGGQPVKPLVKILDMGLARVAFAEDEATGISISHDGTVRGTPDFMAPEQAKNSSMVDWRADIYSLGCTLYYLLTGSVPFPGGTNIEKLLHHQMDTPRPVEQFRNDVPPGVRAILQRMMAKRVEDRLQSGGEVAHALAPFCEGAAPGTAKFKVPAPMTLPSYPQAVPVAPTVGTPRSSTFESIRNLFFDPKTHRARQIGVLIGVAALLGLIGMFVLVLSLLSGWARSPGTGPALASGKQSGKAPLPPPPTATQVKPPPATERRLALDPLPRCLPDGASNVCTFRVPELVRSAVFKQNEDSIKANLSEAFLQFQTFGINIYNDLERATYAVVAQGNSLEGVILLQGTFDPLAFEKTMDANRQQFRQRRTSKNGPSYFELPPASGDDRPRYVAMPNATTFLLATEERVMINALVKMVGNRPADLNDKEVKGHLTNLDDKPTIFIVVGGSFPGTEGTLLDRPGIRCLTAGFRIGDDVQGEFSVMARDNMTLQNLRGDLIANLVSEVLKNMLSDNGTLARTLVGSQASVNPATNTIALRARYTAMEAGRMFKR
jgi:serine/threonine-protein kinase